MNRKFYKIHSVSVLSKGSLSFFDKAIFQYTVHNSKSLIAMMSHKNTIHIITTKGVSRNECSWRRKQL